MPRANFKNHGSGPVKKCGLEPRVMGCKGCLSHLLEEARRYVSQCIIPTSVSPIIQKSRFGLEIRCGPDTSIMLSQQLEGTCPQMSWIPHLCLLIHKEVDAYVRRSPPAILVQDLWVHVPSQLFLLSTAIPVSSLLPNIRCSSRTPLSNNNRKI